MPQGRSLHSINNPSVSQNCARSFRYFCLLSNITQPSYPMAGQHVSDGASPIDPVTWLDQHGDILYRYVLLRVRRRELAEDLVQDTLLAAIEAQHRFAAGSSERTWLISILRRKIVDHFRRVQRTRLEIVERADEVQFFDAKGRRQATVRKWRGDPQRTLEREEFWETSDNVWASCRLPWPTHSF